MASERFTLEVEMNASKAEAQSRAFLSAMRDVGTQVGLTSSQVDKMESSFRNVSTAAATARRTESDYAAISAKNSQKRKAALDKTNGSYQVAAGLATRLGREEKDLATAANGVGTSFGKITNAASLAGKGTESLHQSLSTTRYALYDVSSTLGIAGAAMLGFTAAVYAAGISWEKDFAGVIRTSGIEDPLGEGAAAVERLRQQFIQLGQTLPVTTSELSEIGTLGGQLGIAGQDLQSFTRVVAQLAATTDLSSEAAGTMLGRFQALMGTPADEFDNLASSILQVGTTSVATESQISTIATRIAGISEIAGLTSDTVVGLSAALASVGVQPYAAQGSVIRLFTQMGKAADAGGDKLDAFAKIAGVSADEFASAYGTERFNPILKSFIAGLSDVERNGGSASKALETLGIKGSTDIRTFTQLAGASEEVADAFVQAAAGYANGTELADQYSVIAQTTAAKLQVLANNVQLFFASIADGGTVFGGLLDGLNDFLKWATEINDNPFWGTIAQGAVLLTGLAGAILVVSGAVTRGLGGVIGLAQAYVGLTGTTASATASQTAWATSLGLSSTAMARATTTARVLGAALRSVSLIGLAFALPEIAGAFSDGLDAVRGWGNTTSEVLKRVTTEGENFWTDFQGVGTTALKEFTDMDPFARWAGSTFGLNNISREVTKLGDNLKDIVAAGDYDTFADTIEEASKRSGVSVQDLIDKIPGIKDALNDAGVAYKVASDGTLEFTDSNGKAVESTDAVAEAEAAAEAAAESYAASIGFVATETQTAAEAQKAFEDALKSGSSAFIDWAGMATAAYEEGGGGLQGFIDSLDDSIAAQQAWADDLSELSARGADAFVAQLAAMGPEGAALAADAVNLTADELNKLEEKAELAAFLASDAFASGFTDNMPYLKAAYSAGGLEAVQAMISALHGGSDEVAAVIDQYNIELSEDPLEIVVDNDGAKKKTDETLDDLEDVNNYYANPKVDADNKSANDKIKDTETKLSNVSKQTWIAKVQQSGAGPASTAIQQLLAKLYALNGYTATAYVHTVGYTSGNASSNTVNTPRYATGGHVRGPGSATSDSIPAWLSNGEYVIKAAAVRKYGIGMLNALNAGRAPKFASGGPVNISQSTINSGLGGVMELGPRTMSRMGNGNTSVNVMLDDVALARAVQRGNKKLNKRGERG